jgi:phytoene/squalene synthetase
LKQLFDITSAACSKLITRNYSTSFSHGIYFLKKDFHNARYGIYGFVRLADEIVDSFEGYDKISLITKFRKDTEDAIVQKISLNPILNCFQHAVHLYKIEYSLIDTFLKSMEMDLIQTEHDENSYKEYIVGSAEVVGLMCLRVFTNNDFTLYEKLKPNAMKLVKLKKEKA